MTLKPERVVKQEGGVAIVEVWNHEGRRPKVAGYIVNGGKGNSSILHPTIEDAETEFLRRTWGS